jgi:hypothetical protein
MGCCSKIKDNESYMNIEINNLTCQTSCTEGRRFSIDLSAKDNGRNDETTYYIGHVTR